MGLWACGLGFGFKDIGPGCKVRMRIRSVGISNSFDTFVEDASEYT
jgi:hypothetical protein